MQYSAVDYLAGSAGPSALRAVCPLKPHSFAELRKTCSCCMAVHNETQQFRLGVSLPKSKSPFFAIDVVCSNWYSAIE
jgi:hypothetical protein